MDIDVDDIILEKARTLQRYLPAEGQTDSRVRCLGDIPWLVVRMFEHLAGHPIPAHEKPFSTRTEQSQTLQQIIDTLEKPLRLPLSHVTGVGVARLERRQLEDLLQILLDLARNCFPEVGDSSNKESGHVNIPEDEHLTVSQLTCLDSPEGVTCTPRISGQPFKNPKDSTKRAAPPVDNIPAYIDMVPTPNDAIPSRPTAQSFPNPKDSMKRSAARVAAKPAYIDMAPTNNDAIPSRQTVRDERDANAFVPREKSDSTNLKGFHFLEPEQEISYDYERLNSLLEPSKPMIQPNRAFIATRHEPYSTLRRERKVSELKRQHRAWMYSGQHHVLKAMALHVVNRPSSHSQVLL